ncbi:MAG: hypothetical protein SPI71_02150 [Acidaminococcaceae bacterium]|nr:hypothetical protein [Acidaminococcaceae bacterium]
MCEILAEATFPSVIHNNEVCDEIVKWGNANGFPVQKAKLYNKMDGYVGFSPDNYFIKATRLPPVPGGWKVVVSKYVAEERIIPLNVKKDSLDINRFIVKMMDEYVKEGLKMELAETSYESYGTFLRDLKVVGHPALINSFEDFIENMR